MWRLGAEIAEPDEMTVARERLDTKTYWLTVSRNVTLTSTWHP
jgi:hypothetical protein